MQANLSAERVVPVGRRLTGIYVQCFVWYLLGVIALWVAGIEGVYAHPTPFYALFSPVFDSLLVPGTVLALCWLGYLAIRLSTICDPVSSKRRMVAAIVLWALLTVLLGAGLGRTAVREGRPLLDVLGDHWTAVRWHLPAITVSLAAGAALCVAFGRLRWFEEEPSPRTTRAVLMGIFLFLVLFAAAVAMIRGGFSGISQAYTRYRYEYIGDIGQGGSIRGLFRNYEKLHPYLSLHGKAHPPGATAILWVLCYVFGTGEMGLSIATILFGTLGIVPLYLWAKDLTDRRTALIGCMLYAVIPSIVLFTATSGDILFVPFSLTTLFLFWRAIHRRSVAYALAAGSFYALCSLISFTQLSIGAFFVLVGLWRLKNRSTRFAVAQTALCMITGFAATHAFVWFWSNFNVFACFDLCHRQFYLDQFHLDQAEPRYAGWVYRFLNPMTWFYFAGIPVSALLIWRLVRPDKDTKALFICFALTLAVLDLCYLGRGEGERSALYVYPFMVVPAAHLLGALHRTAKVHGPLFVTLAFMAFQCWFTESYFYTYW